MRVLNRTRIGGYGPAAIALGLLALAAPLAALDPSRHLTQYIQSHYTSEDGLPQNSVHAIAQTRDGYLWMGTEEGLTRFDGVHFKVFTREDYPGLGADYIRSLESGPEGELWVGTDSGLSRLRQADGAGGAWQIETLTTVNGLGDNLIASLMQDADGSLWIGTGKGVDRLVNGRIEHWRTELASGVVYAIERDRAGVIWIGSDSGLARLERNRFVPLGAKDGLPPGRVESLAGAADGSLWVGTGNAGLYQVRQGRAAAVKMASPGKEISALMVDRQGALWLNFDRRGIGRLAGGRLESYEMERGLPSNRCTTALFEDREGGVWVGFSDAGAVQLRDGAFAVFGKPEGLAGEYVGNMLQAPDGSIWIGADQAGVSRLLPDGGVETWDSRRGLPGQAVYSMGLGPDGSIWVGYRNGTLARIAQGRIKVFHDPEAHQSSLINIFFDRSGTLWTGYWGKGLARFENGRFHHLTVNEHMAGIAQAPDGSLWLATDGEGLEHWDGHTMSRLTTAQGLPSDHLMCVLADADGSVWAGTASGGLSLIRQGRVVYTWRMHQGLPASTVGSILDDGKGSLWFGSDSGIFRIERHDLERTLGDPALQVHALLYGTEDGLRTRESLYETMPGSWRDRAGRLWFATIKGAAVIDPAHVPFNPQPPPVWIDHALADGKPLALRDGLRIGPGTGDLQIGFNAPSMVSPDRMRFRYRLVGFDRDWIDVRMRRTAYYTHLPAGRYLFEVQAANSDGVWNRAGASLEFTVVAPLARSLPALILYLLLGVAAIWGAIRLRTRQLLRHQGELNRTVAERTRQLVAEKQALEEARKQLEVLATHDSLTGLFNRGAMLEHLEREMARAMRDHTTLGVLMADLDHFKLVNDQHGHLCGDEVLKETASRLRTAMRGYDVAGRYGGEEFLILFPDFDMMQSPERVSQLLEAIGSQPFLCNQGELRVSCSVGVGTFRPEIDAPNVLEVIGRADDALYAAKSSGRACARFETRNAEGEPDPGLSHDPGSCI